MGEIRERFVTTNGIKLHLLEAGPADGPMILFLHGFPDCSYAWNKQLGYFADRGYLVVAPDQRGYNLSDKPPGIESYSLDELARDAIGLIDFYKREQVYLVGHDLGGLVSWWTAAHYPERIRKLVIMNCPHPIPMGINMRSNVSQIQRSWYVYFFQIPRAPERMVSAKNFSWPVNVLDKTSRPGTFTGEQLEKYRTAFAQPGACEGMINWYRSFVPQFMEEQPVPRIKMPTLVFWGKNDTALLPEVAEMSVAHCDDGKVRYFEDATHWVQHEEYKAINPAMEEFLR